ncbi:MAG: hypothetical protein PHE88_10600 [Elusimicrobia bacterium]|nr:hypothetical protein [Elusimicrobiota bacterium]
MRYFKRVSLTLVTVISIGFICSICKSNELYDAFLENSLTRVLKNNVYLGKEKAIALCSAKDEYESGQIIIIPKGKNDIKGIKIQFSDLAGKDSQGKIIKINTKNFEYYPVAWKKGEFPTDWGSIGQQMLTQRNLTMADATGLQPDPFRPDTVFDAHPGQNFIVWLTFYIPKDTVAGTYTGTVSVIPQNGKREELKISLTVWDFVLMDKCPLDLIPWADPFAVSKYTNMDLFEYYKYDAKHMLKLHRGNSYLRWDIPKDNFSTFDRETEELMKLGMDKFISYVDGLMRDGNGVKHQTGPERQAILKRMSDHLKEKGWLNNFMLVCWDEPDFTMEGILEEWQKSQQEIKDAGFPNWFSCFTEGGASHALDQMIGYNSVWMTDAVESDMILDFFKERKKAGDKIAWYYGSGGRYIPGKALWNLPIEGRTIDWLAFRYNLDYYMFFDYDLICREGQNTVWISKEEVSPNWSSYVYPNPDMDNSRPVLSSIREHILRDGREDYCYLYMLDQLVKKHTKQGNTKLATEGQKVLEKSLDMVAKNPTGWSVNPSDMFQARKMLAEAILKLK